MELRLPFGSTPLAPWRLLARSYGGANRVAATDLWLHIASSVPFARVCDMRDITALLVQPCFAQQPSSCSPALTGPYCHLLRADKSPGDRKSTASCSVR